MFIDTIFHDFYQQDDGTRIKLTRDEVGVLLEAHLDAQAELMRSKLTYIAIAEVSCDREFAIPAFFLENIQKRGVLKPILIDAKGKIIDGAARYLAAKQLGHERIPYESIPR